MLRLKPVRRSLFGGAVVWALCVALGLSALAATAAAAPQDLDLVSRASGPGGPKGNSFSTATVASSVSADGRYVTFASEATNLDPADTDTISDVFVRDLTAGTTTLVSRATGATGAKGDDNSLDPAISADGRYVTFRSDATNLDPADTDGDRDVFVRDLTAATTTLVSRATGATGAKANGTAVEPAISADGRYVAFSSLASNLDPDDTDGNLRDVFVRDLTADTTTLVSRATGATGAKGNGTSFEPAISADGRYVTFNTTATNLDPADTDTINDVFVRDLTAATTTLVSRATGATGAKGNGSSNEPAISADGRYVTFRSDASNLDPDDTDTLNDVFVRDLTAATTTLVSRATGATGAKGNSTSVEPAISADGRYVAFRSGASNLHPDDTDTINDVFVRDLTAATTTLVSRATGATGAKGNNSSNQPAISADGRYVTFNSSASNLHPDDTDTARDVFLRDTAYDTDGDGVLDGDDDCPGTTSGTIVAADGCPDPDGDGISTNAGDNCPNAANADQANTDGDSQGDACDADDDNDGVLDGPDVCEGTPSGTTVAADGCPDPDGDGVSTNAGDNCPNTANPGQANTDGDAQGDACDADDDNDGVGDGPDVCEGTTSGTTVAADGCPDPDGDGISTIAGDNCPDAANPGQANTDGDAQGDACDADDDNDGVLDGVDECPGTPSGTPVRPDGCANTPPVAVMDTYTAVGGAPLTVPVLTGVLSNDSDADGDALTAQHVAGPSAGTLTLNPNGSFTYTPGEDAVGSDSFTYRAFDGTAYSNTVTVLISVQAGCEGRRATLVGTAGRDVLKGTGGNDVIVALGGNDTIDSGSGNDIICTGSGDDLVEHGSGNDVLRGGSGHDRLAGGSDDDLLYGGAGNDVLDGGSDDDRLFGEDGADRLFGGGYDDHLDGGAGTPDLCDGQGGSDTATASCEQRVDVP